MAYVVLTWAEGLWPYLSADTALSRGFVGVLNMSYTACFVIGAVLLGRFLLAGLRAPKIFSYLLWAVVLFRLLCPFSFASAFSPLPSAEIIPPEVWEATGPVIHSGFAAIDEPINAHWRQGLLNGPPNLRQAQANLLAGLWLAVGLALLLHNLLALLRLRRGLRASAEPLPGLNNVWQAAGLPTAFVLGLLRPQIYLPAELAGPERDYILLHEQTHLRRGDHLVKMLAFAALLLHWFNPLVWLAFYLAMQDMEMACDETVLRQLDASVRPDYSASLLRLGAGRRSRLPLAFSEGNVKSRIKNALNYRRPALWLLLACVLAVGLLTFWLAGNPREGSDGPDFGDLQAMSTIEELADEYVRLKLSSLSFTIADSKISQLDRIAEFDNLLASPVQVWRLQYRFRPDDMSQVNLADFLQEDGWIIEDWGAGLCNNLLVVMQNPEGLELAGEIDQIVYSGIGEGAPRAYTEMAARDVLEQWGYLPPETWPGAHAVAEFTLSDGEPCRLLLSQPATQGSFGIWCVERWAQSNGHLYYEAPYVDMTAQEYYNQVQAECDNGHQPWRLDPEEVARQFISEELGQRNFSLTLINQAELADFQQFGV